MTPSQQVSSVLFFPVNLPPMGMELVFLGKKDCGKVDRPSETSALAGFSLSNGVLSLNFDFSNHLTNWSSQSPSAKVAMETHPLSQAYYRYDEVIKQTSSATDGANVYTFDPVATSHEPTKLTPEVHCLMFDVILDNNILSLSLSLTHTLSLSLSLPPSLPLSLSRSFLPQ